MSGSSALRKKQTDAYAEIKEIQNEQFHLCTIYLYPVFVELDVQCVVRSFLSIQYSIVKPSARNVFLTNSIIINYKL